MGGEPSWCDVYSHFKYRGNNKDYLKDLAKKILLHGDRLQVLNEAIQYLQEHVRDMLDQKNTDYTFSVTNTTTVEDHFTMNIRNENRKSMNYEKEKDSPESISNDDGIKETKYG